MSTTAPRPTVYFFCGRSPLAELAFEVASTTHTEWTWRRYTLVGERDRAEFEAGRHSPDLVLSLLNGYIVKPALLEAAGGRAFNVHPGPPEYPGRDPWHFAYYDGFPRAGATLHRMSPRVDDGEILDVAEREFDPTLSVVEYAELCRRLAVSLLLRNLAAILAGAIEPRCRRTWRAEAKRSRRDFTTMCEVDSSMSADEIARRLRSFHDPRHENVYTVIHGHKFFYRPAPAPGDDPSDHTK
ncbi:MAG TPA: formyltransferase family protein [Kofleriaceae bacterium]|nr:formyltransferase family protein [Kofleriaceae bacterium]